MIMLNNFFDSFLNLRNFVFHGISQKTFLMYKSLQPAFIFLPYKFEDTVAYPRLISYILQYDGASIN